MTGKIRVLAICIFSDAGRILAAYGRDEVKDETFYRPFGGGVEFGERSIDALRREIREELAEEISEPRLLDVLENVYEFNGKTGHEVVFVFDAKFANPELYERPVVQGIEAGKSLTLQGHWIRIADAIGGAVTVYPAAIVNALRRLA